MKLCLLVCCVAVATAFPTNIRKPGTGVVGKPVISRSKEDMIKVLEKKWETLTPEEQQRYLKMKDMYERRQKEMEMNKKKMEEIQKKQLEEFEKELEKLPEDKQQLVRKCLKSVSRVQPKECVALGQTVLMEMARQRKEEAEKRRKEAKEKKQKFIEEMETKFGELPEEEQKKLIKMKEEYEEQQRKIAEVRQRKIKEWQERQKQIKEEMERRRKEAEDKRKKIIEERQKAWEKQVEEQLNSEFDNLSKVDQDKVLEMIADYQRKLEGWKKSIEERKKEEDEVTEEKEEKSLDDLLKDFIDSLHTASKEALHGLNELRKEIFGEDKVEELNFQQDDEVTEEKEEKSLEELLKDFIDSLHTTSKEALHGLNELRKEIFGEDKVEELYLQQEDEVTEEKEEKSLEKLLQDFIDSLHIASKEALHGLNELRKEIFGEDKVEELYLQQEDEVTEEKEEKSLEELLQDFIDSLHTTSKEALHGLNELRKEIFGEDNVEELIFKQDDEVTEKKEEKSLEDLLNDFIDSLHTASKEALHGLNELRKEMFGEDKVEELNFQQDDEVTEEKEEKSLEDLLKDFIDSLHTASKEALHGLNELRKEMFGEDRVEELNFQQDDEVTEEKEEKSLEELLKDFTDRLHIASKEALHGLNELRKEIFGEDKVEELYFQQEDEVTEEKEEKSLEELLQDFIDSLHIASKEALHGLNELRKEIFGEDKVEE